MFSHTNHTGNRCEKCGKMFTYIGDIPQGGFPVGSEPWCTCGTHICSKCGQRVPDKVCDHNEEASDDRG